MSLIFGHVEGHCILDQQLKVSFDEFIRTIVVGSLNCLFSHLMDADRIANSLPIPYQFFIIRLVEVLELVEEFEFLNHIS